MRPGLDSTTAYGIGAFTAVLAAAIIPASGKLALTDGTCECR